MSTRPCERTSSLLHVAARLVLPLSKYSRRFFYFEQRKNHPVSGGRGGVGEASFDNGDLIAQRLHDRRIRRVGERENVLPCLFDLLALLFRAATAERTQIVQAIAAFDGAHFFRSFRKFREVFV